jgi:hypothetical protein
MIVGGLPVLKHVPGFRPLTRIVAVDFPETHQHMMRALCQPGRATFFAPNHPEFFTDWMVDKHILDRVAPNAASWATHSIVNGMGKTMQRFWLANNLIAQIPGGGTAAKNHSVAWAAAGHGVLLHPEGRVGWHMDTIASVFPGAVEMAHEVLKSFDEVTEAYVVPIVWRPVFTKDMTTALWREYRYICDRTGVVPWGDLPSPADGVYHLYSVFIGRVEQSVLGATNADESFRQRHAHLCGEIEKRIACCMGVSGTGNALVRAAERWLRQHPEADKRLLRQYQLLQRIGSFAWQREQMTQEEVAEHCKRLRTDYCTTGWRDTVHRFVPRAIGSRKAYIRMCDPIPLHTEKGAPSSIAEAVTLLQARLQQGTDALREEVKNQYRVWYKNPFLT